MPDFARLGEEAILRWNELTNEEMHFYIIVTFHSYPNDKGIHICRKDVKELCRIHNLDYDNTTRRYSRLRTGIATAKHQPKTKEMKSPWLKKSKEGIIPLVGVRNKITGSEIFEIKKERKTVNSTVNKTVKNTVNEGEKTVNSTVENCKNYSKKDQKTVNSTVSSSLYTESSSEVNQNTHTEAEKDVCVEILNVSKFSFEELLQYAKNQIGIKNPIGLATSLMNGQKDQLLENYFDSYEPVEEKDPLLNALELLQEAQAEGFEINDYKQFHTKEEWEWLMSKLEVN